MSVCLENWKKKYDIRMQDIISEFKIDLRNAKRNMLICYTKEDLTSRTHMTYTEFMLFPSVITFPLIIIISLVDPDNPTMSVGHDKHCYIISIYS